MCWRPGLHPANHWGSLQCSPLKLAFSKLTHLETLLKKLYMTLGMVGVVGVFVAKIVGHFEGPKGAKIHREAPICSSSQLSAMAVLSAQKVSAKKMWKF